MKAPPLFFFIAPLVAICLGACGRSGEDKKPSANLITFKAESVKVGMTYDEVERLLGRPSQIVRGSNQLKMSLPSSDPNATRGDLERSLRALKFGHAVAETASSSNVWPFPHVVETIGQLIYVNWVYSKASAETCYVWHYNEATKAETYKVPAMYLVSGVEVSKGTFDVVKDGQTVYFTRGREYLCSKSEWEADAKRYTGGMPPPVAAKKEIRYETKERLTIVTQDPTKSLYVVKKYFSVLFDASSGRVVKSDYEPFDVQAVVSTR